MGINVGPTDPDLVNEEYWAREAKHRETAKIEVSLEEFFDYPMVRSFDHPHDAQEYIDDLSAKVLPNIKEYIAELSRRSDRISFSL